MKKFDVIALGELLIDFTESGISRQGNILFEVNPGGAPGNVLAMLNKLGRKTAFIGKVGNDRFGDLLKQAIKSSGADISGIVSDDNVNTTLAFIHNLKDGDREFSFYRNPGADMMLEKADVNTNIIKCGHIFHYGTLSLTHKSASEATKYAVDTAKNNGLLISFDPNLRESLWDSLQKARQAILYGLSNCDILKISDNEIEFLTGTTDYISGMQSLRKEYDIPLVFVTMGKKGSMAFYKDIMIEVPAFLNEATIETTGAGDTFFGCVLNDVLVYGIDGFTEKLLQDTLIFANAAAALITTRRGALSVMPCENEIKEYISNIKKEDA